MNLEIFKGSKPVPFIEQEINITLNGELSMGGKVIDINVFNLITNLSVNDTGVLVAITYQRFNWPPVYWRYLRLIRLLDNTISPENILLAINEPVESLEFPGFFMIPYFSNYVISKDGRLIKKSQRVFITASEGSLGYRTFRMMSDSGTTNNQLRHRMLCMAFKPYASDIEELDINHRNCIPGDDDLDNLEWCTRSENMLHAYANGLRRENKPVMIRDINTGIVLTFPSCNSAGKELGLSETTVSNRAKAMGYKAYSGMQFRFFPNSDPWPDTQSDCGGYLIDFPNGTSKRCDSLEAARLLGVTRTSLHRLIREGRDTGMNGNRVTRI